MLQSNIFFCGAFSQKKWLAPFTNFKERAPYPWQKKFSKKREKKCQDVKSHVLDSHISVKRVKIILKYMTAQFSTYKVNFTAPPPTATVGASG